MAHAPSSQRELALGVTHALQLSALQPNAGSSTDTQRSPQAFSPGPGKQLAPPVAPLPPLAPEPALPPLLLPLLPP